MEREDFFRGSSVFIFIPLILTKFINWTFAICISQTRTLAREGRTFWARTRRWISSGSLHGIDLSLRGNKRTSFPSVDFRDLDSSHFPGAKKKMDAGGSGEDPHLSPGPGATPRLSGLSPRRPSFAKRAGSTPRENQAPAFRRGGLPLPSLPHWLRLLRAGLWSLIPLFRNYTFESKNREGQGPGTRSNAREHGHRLESPYRSGPRSTLARTPPPASFPRGGVARTRRHLGRPSRHSVYYSMVARSRPAPPQSLSGGAATAAAPSLYKSAVPGCEWITMYLSGKPIIINVTPRGSQWWWSGGGGGWWWDTSKLGTSLRLYKRRRKKKPPTRFVWGKIITILCWYFFYKQ